MTRTSPGESRDLSFIPKSILLLPPADVAHQMGAENGALPKLPWSALAGTCVGSVTPGGGASWGGTCGNGVLRLSFSKRRCSQVDQQICTSLGWGSGEAHVATAASKRSGGIILAWKEDLFDHASTWTGRHLVAARLINRRDGSGFVVASAYGPTTAALWSEMWDDLVTLQGAHLDSPILIGEDFNVTIMANDRLNGGGGRDLGASQFREVIASLGMTEMGPSDQRFTWRGPTTQSRLDRFLCTTEILDSFPLAEVTSLPRPLSNHTPIYWTTQLGEAKAIYFKMDRSWLRDGGLKQEITEWWCSRLTFRLASDKLLTKLKDLCHHLFARRRQIRTSRTQMRDAALAQIFGLDNIEDARPLTPDEKKERKACRDEVAKVDLHIEMDWRQRSCQLWLTVGDANTRFFHQAANGRRLANNIYRLQINDQTYSERTAIVQALSNHFQDFYRRGPPCRWQWHATGAATLPPTQHQQLTVLFSEEEVKVAIRGLNREGAPGSDCIPVFVYSNCWDTLGPEVMATLEDFRVGRCNLDRLNRAYIVLIPKVPGTEHVRDFHPILLSNSIYLIIAKVLANRLRKVLSPLISPLQSALLPGRQMADSIVLAEEIVAAWQRNDTTGFTWKVDFSKAYDTLD